MDKATLFVMAVLFEAQAAQDAFRIRTSLFLNLNFGQLAAKAALHTSSLVYDLADAKQFANDFLQEKLAQTCPRP